MFTFEAMPVKFVGLIVLFAWCTVWSIYELTRPQPVVRRISNAAHLVMSVVMLLMVWTGVWNPFVSVVGMPILIGFFALSTAWFGYWGLREPGRKTLFASTLGHAAMFGAMTWHLIAMAIKRSAMMSVGGMGTPGAAKWTAEASKVGGPLWVVALIGVPFMLYLLIAGINDVRRAFLPRAAASSCACGENCTCGPECSCGPHVPASPEVREQVAVASGEAEEGSVRVLAPDTAVCHAVRVVGTTEYRLAALADAAMNLGMFWMSTGLMVALLPFMKFLSF